MLAVFRHARGVMYFFLAPRHARKKDVCILPIVCYAGSIQQGAGDRKDKMFTLRRFALAVISLPIALAVYAGIYFGLFLVSGGFASYGLMIQNFWAVGFGWVVAVTFSKQIFDLVERLSN